MKQSLDLRIFIPSMDYGLSRNFYQALGFKMEKASEKLTIFSNGQVTFFLQDYYEKNFANNLMLQLLVDDIEAVYQTLENIQDIEVRFNPIKEESWGKVIYLWGPAGELWHITQLNASVS